MARNTSPQAGMHPGGHFTPGYYRPDRPGTGTPVPEPEKPERKARSTYRPEVGSLGNRTRDERTETNVKAKEDALAPKRWRPG